MTRTLTLWLSLLLLLVWNIQVLADDDKPAQLAKELAVFQPFLGTWQADFAVPAGKPPMRDISHWERALNGTAVRTLHSINAGMYGGESLIFWDKSKNAVVFYYFTTAGFYTHGTIEVLSPTEFVAFEDVTGNKDGITQVKSISRFKDNHFEVSTQYLKQGKWTEPEQRTYVRSNEVVQFK
ncbi:hypothetical protein [Pseudoalteromonas sp. R3]|uniref:hypothetical protein n=1 Tax=Pseudoalteromonas sp. R3 TaxID=1709477 RepID=UPI0006B4F139|nr:hypothetical protein [Pseudoalteromonas sp. R3]AZZ99935.1 hypothetical protein ELR70_24410 [Pseudoalteromonas sp. R3]